MPELNLSLHERQGIALLTNANEILFGGAAGGGKSHLLRAAGIHFCVAVPGLQAYLFRKTYGDLMKNHMEGSGSFPAMLAPLIASKHVRIVDKEIRFWNGSKIWLNHLQHEKDVFSYQGQEIHLLLFDELTHFSESSYRYLRGRCRLGGLAIPAGLKQKLPRILACSNPGGIGHNWVKRTFVTNGPMKVVRTTRDDGRMLRQFIPSALADNPTLLLNDPEYANRLYGLGDAVLVRAMLEGDWNIVAGAMFGDAWRPSLHTVDPFPIPDDWQIWRGADDGFSAPASVHWFTQDPAKKTFYVIDELYRAKMRPDEFARRILEHDRAIKVISSDGTEGENKEPLGGVMDSAAFGDVGLQQDIPRGHQLNKLGCKFIPAEKWPGSRVARVKYFHQLMGPNPNDPRGLPHIRFFRNHCPFAIETIPTLPRDVKNTEDVDTDGEDHAFDSVSYGLQWKQQKVGRRKVSGT